MKYIQVISLVLLTVGVMLCNMKFNAKSIQDEKDTFKGICATLGIAISSGFASVYTEKVIKAHRATSPISGAYSLGRLKNSSQVSSFDGQVSLSERFSVHPSAACSDVFGNNWNLCHSA